MGKEQKITLVKKFLWFIFMNVTGCTRMPLLTYKKGTRFEFSIHISTQAGDTQNLGTPTHAQEKSVPVVLLRALLCYSHAHRFRRMHFTLPSCVSSLLLPLGGVYLQQSSFESLKGIS